MIYSYLPELTSALVPTKPDPDNFIQGRPGRKITALSQVNQQLRAEVLALTDQGFQHIEYRSVFHSQHSSLRGVDIWLDSRPQGTLAHFSSCKASIKDCGGHDGPLRCTMGMQSRLSCRVEIQLRPDVADCIWDCMANPVVRLWEEKMWRSDLKKSLPKHPRSNDIYIFTSEERVPFFVESRQKG